ncbi:MAG: nitronate monooxygenase [bacterium]
MPPNKITTLFGIRYPIIQGGMIWCSGWELAAAVSNAGGLGLIGSGSMTPDILEEHILKCREATNKPFGVNLPLIYRHTEQHIEMILKHRVNIVFSSAGSPAKYTERLKKEGVRVAHVIANSRFAQKAVEAGVDAIVAEGFEAGGHNGLEETTTMVLVPAIRRQIDIPLIAAGGIGSGMAMYAAMALGADGVQVGSRFAASAEASGHPDFKRAIIQAKEGSTKLTLKKVIPVRLIKNDFFERVEQAESSGAGREELSALLGKGRARMGMFEGDLKEGELEIGQVSSLINEVEPVHQIMQRMIREFNETAVEMGQMRF